MSSIKLKHSGGNAVSISAPDTNPSSDRTVKLPSTDVDGVITTKDSSDNLQAVTGANGTAFSNRNLLINGAHIIWQRATSIAGGSALDNFQRATDRFWLYSPSSTSGTVGQSTDAPSGFIYSTHNNLDAECIIGSNVELLKVGSDAPFVNGESLTLSFYIKSTSARSNVSIAISSRDNAGGTGSVTRATSPTFNTTTSWTRVEKTFTLTGTVGGSNACLQFQITLAVGDKVTGFQLEKGTVATAFEHKHVSVELAACQRYYQIVQGHTRNDYRSDNAARTGNNMNYFTEMRVAPSASTKTAIHNQNMTSVLYERVSKRGLSFTAVGIATTGGTDGQQLTADVQLEAEL
tara:strand:- start:404 stop:1447 length:1044 start_codon:yes stop_codon:yes gene_type:complete